jgi:hypothetical protein
LNNEIIHLLSLRAVELLSSEAYLDPGSGSFILQLLLATLLGLGFVLKGYWRKLLGFFKRNPDKTDDIEEADDE